MFLDKIIRSCKTCKRCYAACDPVWYHPVGNRCIFYEKHHILPFRYYDIREHPKYFCKYWTDDCGKQFDYFYKDKREFEI